MLDRDDAAVYRFASDQWLVQTVDFLTPIVDDPFTFGKIAAANALSDIYAMGAKPLLALNLVAFPTEKLPLSWLKEILQGGIEVLEEAKVLLAGGHTIRDEELKYGLAVTGKVTPGKLWRKAGALPGDVLLLTKPIGTGVIATALKRGKAPQQAVETMVQSMVTLNKTAAEILGDFTVHAATDITGFGLAGHLLEMLLASKVTGRLFQEKINWLPGAVELAEADIRPGACVSNRQHVEGRIVNLERMPSALQTLLWDPQTSGGLLVCLPADEGQRALERLLAQGVAAAIIGEISEVSENPKLIVE